MLLDALGGTGSRALLSPLDAVTDMPVTADLSDILDTCDDKVVLTNS